MFPRLPFLCPPLVGNFVSFDIRFQFSNVDRIGNFHHQNKPHSVQTCPQGRAGKRKEEGVEACEIRVCQYLYYMRGTSYQ